MDRNYPFTMSRFGSGWDNKEEMLMTNFTIHAYRGDQDLSAMLALIRTGPTGRILDFPSLYDHPRYQLSM